MNNQYDAIVSSARYLLFVREGSSPAEIFFQSNNTQLPRCLGRPFLARIFPKANYSRRDRGHSKLAGWWWEEAHFTMHKLKRWEEKLPFCCSNRKNCGYNEPETDARPIYRVSQRKKNSRIVTPFTLLLQFVTEDCWGIHYQQSQHVTHLSTPRHHCQEGEEFPRKNWLAYCDRNGWESNDEPWDC